MLLAKELESAAVTIQMETTQLVVVIVLHVTVGHMEGIHLK